MSNLRAATVGAIALCFSCQTLDAGELIYRPTNPGFGGNPNNIDYLLNLAQIQNQHLPDSGTDGGSSAAPTINFPPITIDLGGVAGGGGTTADPNPAAAALSGDATMQVGNGSLTSPVSSR